MDYKGSCHCRKISFEVQSEIKRHNFSSSARSGEFPTHIRALAFLYCIASLVHFSHNAEYLPFYPNMPDWLTREQVYMVWIVVTSVGVAALVLHALGRRIASALVLALYGAFGFDALGHYALALCSQHTLVQNVTIWFEVLAGATLLASCVAYIGEHIGSRDGDVDV
jgi:hypothetical protein